MAIEQYIGNKVTRNQDLPGVKGGEPQLAQSNASTVSGFNSGSAFTFSYPSNPENIGFSGVAKMSCVLLGLPIELPDVDNGGVAG